MKKRFALRCLTAAALSTLVTAPVLASDPYPTRPIRIVVNSAAGALLDVTTRAVAQKMSETLGQPIIIDNRPGADGQLGIRYLKTVPADGYTILASANTIAQLPALKLDPGYDLAKDFVGVGMMTRAPLILVSSTSLPDKTLSEFIARAKANPNVLNFASAGVGTSTHMAASLFLHQTGIKMTHVPYKGNAAAMPDVISGRVNAIFDGANSSAPNIAAGKLRAYGVSTNKRVASLPDIPTLAEQGLPNYNFSVYLGLVAPSAVPKDIVSKLSQALRTALNSDTAQERIRKDGGETGTLFSEEFTEFLRQDMNRSIQVVNDLGIPKE
jgi:tripartite-type tricarboxylate transporter receptor subunit TctC